MWTGVEFDAYGHRQQMRVGFAQRAGSHVMTNEGVLKSRWEEYANRQTYRAD